MSGYVRQSLFCIMCFFFLYTRIFSQGLVNESDPEPVKFGDYEFTYPDNNLQYFPVQVDFLYSNKFFTFFIIIVYINFYSICIYTEHSNQSIIWICRIEDTQQSRTIGLYMFIQVPRSWKTSLKINRIRQRFLFINHHLSNSENNSFLTCAFNYRY